MTEKILKAILAAASAVLLCAMALIMGYLYRYFGGLEENELREELSLAAAAVEQEGADYLRRVSDGQSRLSWIAADGSVLFDTAGDAGALENHAGREEFRQALENGEGSSVRYSSTLLEKTMYAARRLSDGTVLRISISRASVGMLLLGVLQPAAVIFVAALLLSGVLAKSLARRIVEPLNELDLEHPLENNAYEELAPLLGRLHRQHEQIDGQMKELERRTSEFAQVTRSMQEGLVLLDASGYVLHINNAARELFGADYSCVGKDFLTVDRDPALTEAIRAARREGHSEIRSQRNGKIWQFDLSRTEPGGTVLLAFDITAQVNAEQNRREFTANVSHELKTPLQGIIGSAELIENGMVKPEDMGRFVGHIRSEAQRMVSLINDIIRLSQLDEGVEMPRERVDLTALAREAADDLRGEAERKQVRVTVEGGEVRMTGVRGLLYEAAHNLCENAIKYNREGGEVRVTVGQTGGEAVLTVADTGIGIPPEHQSRVFERFYRVDKSHSKASGGTGLGLSIVKHAVQAHNGKISLTSTPGEGTTITLRFPQSDK